MTELELLQSILDMMVVQSEGVISALATITGLLYIIGVVLTVALIKTLLGGPKRYD